MSKKGLPTTVQMRHDLHYVEELGRTNRPIGKILPIDKIEPNPEQPRTEIGDLSELVNSIKQNGVLEPLLVKPNRVTGNWMIIAGERRWRASNLAGLREVPCIELDLDEKSIAEIALIENLQRKDLTIWEEADGLKSLKDKFGYTQEEIAKKISKSRTTVTESLTIAGLPESIRAKCRELNISAKSTLLEIARQFDENAMHEFLFKIDKNGTSREKVRQTARPEKNTEKTLSNKSTSLAEKKKGEVFIYNSTDADEFVLEIKFNVSFQKRDVLKALKEAFDNTKSNA